MKRKKLGNLTAKQAYHELINNNLNWYVVKYTDGSFDCAPQAGLACILECDHDLAVYDIEQLYRCWNGQNLGECPW